MEAYCRQNKYPDASVSWTLTAIEETGAADLTVVVDEGEKLRVKKINFYGDRFLSDSRMARTGRFFTKLVPGNGRSDKAETFFETNELRSQLQQKKTFWFTPWFGPYRPELTDMDVMAVKNFYLANGFLDVVVDSPEVEKLGRGRIGLNYHIAEGGQYRVGSLDVEGATLFEPAELKKQIRLKSEDIASQAEIDAAAASVTRYYGNRGYIRSYVEPIVQTDPSALRADIVFRVHEGALAHINLIEIRGNEKTRDEVIRRELAVYPGELFHQQKVETSEKRLKNLGYFETVDSSYVPVEEGTNTYNLDFNVKEKAMGTFLIGAGFSSVDSLVGFAELSHGNFDIRHWPPVGDGQKMKVRVQGGSTRNDLEVSFVEPWFMDRKLSLGVDLYHRDAGYYSSDYQLKTIGGRVSLSKPLSPFTRATLSYSLESFDVYEVSTNAASEIQAEEGARLKSTVGLSVSRDTRDQFFIPTRGNRTTLSAEFSGGPLAGDTEIYFLKAETSHYWPLWKEHVLSVHGEVRMVEGYGDGQAVPIFDKLFLGGPRNLRGFAYRDVSPRSGDGKNGNPLPFSDEPIGGKSSYFASAEYTVPLWSKIRGAVFYDIGAVNEGAFDVGTEGLNSDYGFGFRFDLPMFPLRLDYAFPQITDSNNEGAGPRWNFLLGYTF